MRKIIAIGESVLDTVYSGDQPTRSFVGGRIANAAAILGTMGLPVAMVSECCADRVGDIIIDYYAIPNHQGSYTIPPVSLVWFNPADGQYHTSTTGGPITVKVLKGDPNSYAARQRLRNDDIRYIHLGDSAADSRSGFWGTPLFWCLHLLLIALFIFIVRAVFSLSRRSRKPSAAKMAGRVGKDIPSTLLALKQFVAERCGVSEAEVSKDRISALFAERGVDADLTSRLLTLIDSCELHIYGAATPDPDAAGRLGTEAAEVIARLRKQLKKVKK